jgi:hypothetical protein
MLCHTLLYYRDAAFKTDNTAQNIGTWMDGLMDGKMNKWIDG